LLIHAESPNRFAKWIWQIDLPNGFGKSIRHMDRIQIRIANSIWQIELPNRQSEFESPNQFGKSIWQMDSEQHINWLQIKFAIQIGLLTASI
jgi:hypothetical protein